MAGSSRAGDLHLRLTGFNQTDARILARGMQDAVAGNALVEGYPAQAITPNEGIVAQPS